ncbi:hypothetical protein GCM10027168_35270 [Streptomyces capparidis]
MLWSDRTREIAPEVRRAQTMLRRAGPVIALAAGLLMLLLVSAGDG